MRTQHLAALARPRSSPSSMPQRLMRNARLQTMSCLHQYIISIRLISPPSREDSGLPR
ncbi:hypothetical protein [Spirosoma pollinicola]|uniref:hypothetical protein n=1 Tax=Spirosoma pollinicola TaxID=2057025 RepID=UPI0012FE00BF|nr:hypothetical protein [Spirosoma pollinicola]